MSHWNYRLVREHHVEEGRDEHEVLLVEAYYNDAGQPDGYTAGGCRFGGDTEADVLEAMTNAMRAFQQPVLEEQDFKRT